jgi:hypothetical protein
MAVGLKELRIMAVGVAQPDFYTPRFDRQNFHDECSAHCHRLRCGRFDFN